MAPFKTLGHIAFKVHDLDASLAFYGKLGFPEMLRLLNDKGEAWIVYLRVTDELYLELFPLGVVCERIPPENNVGMTHLCLTSPDLDMTEAHLKSVGVPLSRPRGEKRGLDGNRGMWVEDPDGNRIEIMEMAPDCIQHQAVKRLREGKPPQALKLSP